MAIKYYYLSCDSSRNIISWNKKSFDSLLANKNNRLCDDIEDFIDWFYDGSKLNLFITTFRYYDMLDKTYGLKVKTQC